MNNDLRCLVYVNKVKSKNTAKGQAKLCSTAYIKDMCRCENCKACNRITKNIYRKNNLEKIREYQKKYRKENPKKVKKYYYKSKKRVIKDLDLHRQKKENITIGIEKRIQKNSGKFGDKRIEHVGLKSNKMGMKSILKVKCLKGMD
jgi:hypothetical protein